MKLGLFAMLLGYSSGAAAMGLPWPWGLIVGSLIGLIGGCVAAEADLRAARRG